MFGLTEILVALVALTIVLAGVFLVRSSITAGATGKILAFIGLCVLPALCIGTGMSFHMQRSQQTAYCISCHSMESHGKSLYVLDTNYIPARHFQNHLVPPDNACYACHTDYTMYGPLKDKLKGLRYLYMEYVSTPPKTIRLDGVYSNLQCLHCHAGMRSFDENPAHTAVMGSLKSNRTSCISCHNTIHNASEVDHLKMWVDGDAPPSVAVAAAPTTTELAATAAPSKVPTASSGGDAIARGKNIFDSQRCGGCHGADGAGGTGPALTRTSSKYSQAQLTAVLTAPTAKLKAAGMVPLTLNAADMKALVSYVSNLGGTSAVIAKTPAPGSPPANAKPGAPTTPLKIQPATPATQSDQPPSQTTASTPGEAATGAVSAAAAQGKTIFDSHGCGGCHGVGGIGGTGSALTRISDKYQPAQLAALVKEPNAKMKAGGMVPLTLNAADLTALVSYMSSLGGTSIASATTPAPSSEPAQPGPQAKTEAANPAPAGQPGQGGEAIYNAQGCAGCHGPGGSGTARASALTKLSNTITAEALTSLLQNPNPKMQSGGMTPTKLSATEMSSLVAYLQNLGSAGAVTGAVQDQYAENKDDVRVHVAAYPAAIQKGYRIFAVKCKQCHGLDESLKVGASPEKTAAEVTRMQAMASSQISDQQARAIMEFLNYNREHRKPQD